MRKHSMKILAASCMILFGILCPVSETAAQNASLPDLQLQSQKVAVSYYKTAGNNSGQLILFRTWPRDRALYDEDARQVIRSLKEKAEVKQVSYDKELQEFSVQPGTNADVSALRWEFKRSKYRKANRNP